MVVNWFKIGCKMVKDWLLRKKRSLNGAIKGVKLVIKWSKIGYGLDIGNKVVSNWSQNGRWSGVIRFATILKRFLGRFCVNFGAISVSKTLKKCVGVSFILTKQFAKRTPRLPRRCLEKK